MKVVLVDNVKNIGQKGAVVEVPDGLARNRLLPTKKAVEATSANIAKYASVLLDKTQGEANRKAKLLELVQLLTTSDITVRAPADSHGTLYQSVHEKDIMPAIHTVLPARYHAALRIDDIVISNPIKKTGEHTISIHGNPVIIRVTAK